MAKEYGWTFEQISQMPLQHQLIAQRGSKYRTFGSAEEYQAYMAGQK